METFKKVVFATVSKMHFHICIGLIVLMMFPPSTPETMFWDLVINVVASACGYALADYSLIKKDKHHENT